MNKKGVFVFLLLLVSLIIISVVQAETYYVSDSQGDDSNTGLSESNPWKTIDKVNTEKFHAGDNVLFKKGDTFEGRIKLLHQAWYTHSSGEAGQRLVFSSYGSGPKPIIDGSTQVTGWTKHEGNIYKASLDAPDVTQLFLDGKRMTAARYPNSGYARADSVLSPVKLRTNDLDTNLDYVGALVYAKTVKYKWWSARVTNSLDNTITIKFDSDGADTLSNGVGYLLLDKYEFLDQPGEWYYNETINELYFWSPNNDDPDNYNIRASIREEGFYLSGPNYTTITGFNFSYSGIYGIHQVSGKNNILSNNYFHYPGFEGIRVLHGYQSDNLVQGNTVIGATGCGLQVFCDYCNITENVVRDVSLFEDLGVLGPGKGSGISLISKGGVISKNRIYDVAYNGIHFSKENVLVENNFIQSANRYLDDGAAIYTWSGSYSDAGSAGSIIRNNIILDTILPPKEHDYTIDSTRPVVDWLVSALYLDNNIHDVTLENNTVINVQGAVSLNSNGRNTVKGNTFFDAMLGVVSAGTKSKHYITDNIFYTIDRLGYLNWLKNSPQKFHHLGAPKLFSFDRNTYVSHYSDDVFYEHDTIKRWMTFEEWQTLANYDPNSQFIGGPLETGETEKIFYNDQFEDMIISLKGRTFKDIYGAPVAGSILLKPFTSMILIGTDFNGIGSGEVSYCGDSYINSGEECDDGSTLNGNVCEAACGDVCNYCSSECTLEIVTGDVCTPDPYCGDGIINLAETCDLGVLFNGIECDSVCDSTCDFCNLNCELQTVSGEVCPTPSYCGDGILDVNEQCDSGDSFNGIECNSVCDSSCDYCDSQCLTQTIQGPSCYIPVESYCGDETIDDGETCDSGFSNGLACNPTCGGTCTYCDVSCGEIEVIGGECPSSTYAHSNYLFEGTGNKIEDLSHIRDGVIVNDVKRVAGIDGNGLFFNRSGYVFLGLSEMFSNIQTELTLSAWVKPTPIKGGYQGIIMHGGQYIDTFALYLDNNQEVIGFKTTGTTDEFTVIPANNLWDGSWHHVLVTYNGTHKEFFVDGESINISEATGYLYSGEGYNAYIGAGRDKVIPELLYEGYLDDIRIYDYALTKQEITDVYALQLTPTCYDGVKNGNEGGIDCGGSCFQSCQNTGSSTGNTDDTNNDEDTSKSTSRIYSSSPSRTYIPVNNEKENELDEYENSTIIKLTWKQNENDALSFVTNKVSAIRKLTGKIRQEHNFSNSSLIIINSEKTGITLSDKYGLYQQIKLDDVPKVVFDSLNVTFEIDDDWFEEKGHDKEEVSIIYLDRTNKWVEASAHYDKKTDSYISTLTQVLSPELLIVSKEKIELKENENAIQPNKANTGKAGVVTKNTNIDDSSNSKSNLLWLWILIIIIIMGVVLLILFGRKKKDEPENKTLQIKEKPVLSQLDEQQPKETITSENIASISPIARQRVMTFINGMKEKQVPDEVIKGRLIDAGWKESDVDGFLNK